MTEQVPEGQIYSGYKKFLIILVLVSFVGAMLGVIGGYYIGWTAGYDKPYQAGEKYILTTYKCTEKILGDTAKCTLPICQNLTG